jgi:hypothetical protein
LTHRGFNALAESVIGLFKTEVIRRKGPWKHLEAVEFATLEWVMANKASDEAAAELYRLAHATALLRMYREANGHEPDSVQAASKWAKRHGPIEPTDVDYAEVARTHPEWFARAQQGDA